MSFPAGRWRAPIIGAATGLVVAAAVVGQSALASGGNTATPHAKARAATASGSGCGALAGSAKDSSDGPGPAPFLAAVAQLVQAGTINQSQANVLDAGIRAGSIDDSQLIANGTLSAAQMQAVDSRLIAIKRSLAPPAGCDASDAGAPAKGPGGQSSGPGPAPFLAAVAQLVQAGTINQSQADVLDAGIRAGSIDDSQLIANGTLSPAQMQAVDSRLAAVKRSLAPAGQQSGDVQAAERKKSQQ